MTDDQDDPALSILGKLDKATLQYITEIKAHFDKTEDAVDRSVIAAQAFSELQGKEVESAVDARGCRILESLVPAATEDSLLKFSSAVFAEEQIIAFTSSPNASHVSEKLLDAVAACGSDEAYKILEGVGVAVASNLYGFMTDKFACHTARRLINIAAGHDVSPPSATSNHFQKPDTKRRGVQHGLATKLTPKQAVNQLPATARLELLDPICEAILSAELLPALSTELPFHQVASPFIQALLLAKREDAKFLEQFIPALLGFTTPQSGVSYDNVSEDDFHAFLHDRTSSHVMEVVLDVASEDMFGELFERYFKGYLATLAQKPVSNFVVQSALANIKKTAEMKVVVRELRGEFPNLYMRQRGGVISAALAAALRTGTGQVELSKALAAAIREHPTSKQGPAAALLTMGLAVNLETLPSGRRLSTLGCTILISVLRFAKEGASEFVESVLDLTPSLLGKVAADASGSRVLEALLESPSGPKVKKKLLKKLQGQYVKAALTPAGNFLVEKCYSLGDMKEKETIAGELAQHEAIVGAQPFGASLLTRCRVADYKRSSKDWSRQVAHAAVVKEQFAELLGDVPSATTLPSAAQAPHQTDLPAAAPKPPQDNENMDHPAESQNKSPRKVKKRNHPVSAEETAAPVDVTEPAPKKRRRKIKEIEEPAAQPLHSPRLGQPAAAATKHQQDTCTTGSGNADEKRKDVPKKKKKGVQTAAVLDPPAAVKEAEKSEVPLSEVDAPHKKKKQKALDQPLEEEKVSKPQHEQGKLASIKSSKKSKKRKRIEPGSPAELVAADPENQVPQAKIKHSNKEDKDQPVAIVKKAKKSKKKAKEQGDADSGVTPKKSKKETSRRRSVLAQATTPDGVLSRLEVFEDK